MAAISAAVVITVLWRPSGSVVVSVGRDDRACAIIDLLVGATLESIDLPSGDSAVEAAIEQVNEEMARRRAFVTERAGEMGCG